MSGRLCPAEALTEVVWGPNPLKGGTQTKVDGGTFFFDAPKVRDLTGAAHGGLGKASGSLPTTEPHVFHNLRTCRRGLCPAEALFEVFWPPQSVRK